MDQLDESSHPVGDHALVFRVLGPFELVGYDGEVHVPPGRQQLVLAALLIRVNLVVSIDQLVDAIWETTPPTTARAQVHYCVHALRQEFTRLRLPAQIVTQSPGYRLEVDESHVDWCLFRDMVTEARESSDHGDKAASTALLKRALELWRGPVLAGFPSQLQVRLTWLEELHTEVLEECVRLQLELGRHREVIGKLRQLVAENPLNETFRGALMLALYRSDRSSEALEVYNSGRAHLIDEVGLEPGEKLQQLQTAILAEDKSLLDPETDGTGPVGSARPKGWWVTPRQLPADIPDLTGRDDLIAALVAVLDQSEPGSGPRSASIVNVTGKAGVGKTVLAVRVAHQVGASYPDGQLYVDLGASQEQPPTPHCVLGALLRSLGVDGASIPDGIADRSAMYRSILADRRVLVVLEDAVCDAQVLPLLPASHLCAVLVTSRTLLAGLPGVFVAQVEVLDEGDSRRLLARQLDDARIEREPAQARALVKATGGLPLALRIVGARLAARPQWSLQSMVDRLADERRRLDELAYGELTVRSSLMLSYAGLDLPAARLLDRVSVLELESLTAWAAGAALDEDGQPTCDLLDRLADAQLLDTALDSASTPRYRFHDLIRVFARERLREHEPTIAHDVLSRVAGGWLTMAERAHCQLYGGDFTTLHGSAHRWPVPVDHLDGVAADPLRWFEQERVNVIKIVAQAADLGLDELCWDLSVTLVSLFEVRSSFDEWHRTHEDSLRATLAAGNVRGTAALRCSLGSLYLTQNRLDEACSVLRPAFDSFRELDDQLGLAMTSRNLGMLDRRTGAADSARTHCQRAYDGFAAVLDPAGQAAVLCQLAQLDLDARDHARAVSTLQQAKQIAGTLTSRRIQAQIHYKLGKVLTASGDYDQASRAISTALDLVRGSGDLLGECYVTQAMGVLQAYRGRLTEATRLLRKAVAGCERNYDRVGVARCLLDLARIEQVRGHLSTARAMATQASATFIEFDLPDWVTKAENILECGLSNTSR